MILFFINIFLLLPFIKFNHLSSFFYNLSQQLIKQLVI